jgi:hypothetical protein
MFAQIFLLEGRGNENVEPRARQLHAETVDELGTPDCRPSR